MLGTLLFIASGSFALWVTRIPWANYWRTREHRADNYAAQLGQAQPLADALENHALAHDLPIPYPWIATNSHPPTEHRIDQLRASD
jgi:Zn-dependent protease with chaperone function